MVKLAKNANKHFFPDSNICLTLVVFWIFFLFIYQGSQFAKNMRYMLPIYPFIAIVIASYLTNLSFRKNVLMLIIFMVWPLAFISIYNTPNTRITASTWIYKNIVPGSVLACEHWDDCLPLPFSTNNNQQYVYQDGLPLFDPDTKEKWSRITSILSNTNYIIISSNRLFNTIPRVPNKYPIASNYYSLLFNEKLGYKKVAEFNSFPAIGIKQFHIEINDLSSDETFTVYDHPPVMIFKNISHFSQSQLFELLTNHEY